MRRSGFKPAGLRDGGGSVIPFPGRNRQSAGSGNRRRGNAVSASGTRGGTGRGRGAPGPGSVIPGSAARQSRNGGQVSTDPGFHPAVKATILRRDGGCVLRGGPHGPCWGPVDAHHRRLLGQGGSSAPESHRASNGIAVCRGHHDFLHRFRLQAEGLGLIVSRYRNPAEVPVSFDGGRTRKWLTDDGDYAAHAPEPEDGPGDVA